MSVQLKNEIRLVHSGNDFFDTLESIIHSAKQNIHFQTYIFDYDATGIKIANALKQAASKGIQVTLVLDAFGSKSLPDHFVEDIKKAGVEFRWFAPLLSMEIIHLGRRLHHKVVVADKETALIGGINISDKYKGNEQQLAWLDYAVLLKGTICNDADKICRHILDKKFKIDKLKDRIKNSMEFYKGLENDTFIKLRQNDRFRRKNEISKSYIRAIRNSQHSITLVSSYFLPGTQISYALKKAAKRGVKVNIIFSGIADVPVLGKAANHLYISFLKSGIIIYEWKKSVLHGKLALVDDEWATVGSFNLNHLSALSSIELNVDIKDKLFANELKKHLTDIVTNGCEKIDYEIYLKNNTLIKRSVNFTAYFLVRTVMRFIALFPRLFSSSREEAAL